MAVRGGVLWLLAIALVAAQAFGFMHRVVHGPQADLAHAYAAEQAHDAHELNAAADTADASHDHHHASAWLSALFAGHYDDSTCRLFDSLSQDTAPGVPTAALPLVLSSYFLQWAQGEALVRWATLFDARGPPSIR
jgi:hypothetical protein